MITTLASYITRPAPDINYNFVVIAYGVGSLISIFLYVLQRIMSDVYSLEEVTNSPQATKASSESMKEFVHSLQGIYLVFVPFIPSFLWSLWIRGLEKKMKSDNLTVKKTE
jgi:hypothetical protein